jgi:hypothetical protein
MTRSDLLLEIASQRRGNPPHVYEGMESPLSSHPEGYHNFNPLVEIMHKKIEAVYSVLFAIEDLKGDDLITRGFHQLGERIRKALEI